MWLYTWRENKIGIIISQKASMQSYGRYHEKRCINGFFLTRSNYLFSRNDFVSDQRLKSRSHECRISPLRSIFSYLHELKVDRMIIKNIEMILIIKILLGKKRFVFIINLLPFNEQSSLTKDSLLYYTCLNFSLFQLNPPTINLSFSLAEWKTLDFVARLIDLTP